MDDGALQMLGYDMGARVQLRHRNVVEPDRSGGWLLFFQQFVTEDQNVAITLLRMETKIDAKRTRNTKNRRPKRYA